MGQETTRTLSLGVARRVRLSLELEDVLADVVADIAAAHAEMVAAKLGPGEPAADVAASLDDYRRVMAQLRQDMVAADLENQASLDEESQLCAQRDRRTESLSKTLSRVRLTCSGWFGPGGLEPLGLADAVAQGPAVVEQARETVRSLRDYAPDIDRPGDGEGPASSAPDFKRWLALLADELEPDLRAVAAFSEALESLRSEAELRSQRRKAAMAEFDRFYLSIGRVAEATLRLSGKIEEADQIHPSTRKLGRKVE